MDKKRKKLIAQLIKTPQGRVQLAAAMNEPLKSFRDYEAVGRRALLVDTLGDGELPYYDKDVDTPAIVIAEDGESVLKIADDVERVFVPLFEIATLVQIPYTQLKQRRYDLESRVKTKTRTEVFRTEDEAIFKAFDVAVTGAGAVNPIVPISSNSVDFDAISDVMGMVEEHGTNRVSNIFINGKNTTIFRKALKDVFDPVTVSEIVSNGFIGTFNGASVHVSPAVPKDRVYFTAEPDFTGRLVESQTLTVLPADEPAKRSIGYSIFEQVGLYIIPSSVSAIQLT